LDCHLKIDADPDPAYNFPDFYLMQMPIQMRIRVPKMMQIQADPDPAHQH
jgi:hypothetical protein